MRILKKSIAIALVVAMVMSVMSIGVFAGDTDLALNFAVDNAAIGQGKATTVTFTAKSMTGSDIASAMGGITVNYDKDKYTAEIVSTAAGITGTTPGEGVAKFAWMGSVVIPSAGVDIAVIKFTAKSDAAVGEAELFAIAEAPGKIFKNTSYGDITCTLGSYPAVSILKAFTVASVTPGTKTVDLGTEEADVIAELDKMEFAVAGANADDKGTLKAENWVAKEYKKDVAGEYTFEGDLVATDVISVDTVNKAVVTVTVSKIALTADMVTTELEGKFMQEAGVTKTAEEVAAALPQTVKVEKNGYEAELAVTWTPGATLALDVVGTSAEVTGTITGADNFEGTATIKGTVTVVPAEVKDCKISVSGTTANSKPVVTVTIPASAGIVAGKKIVVTLAPQAVLGAAVGGTAEYTITDADVASIGDAETFTKKIQFPQSIKTMGFATGDKLAFSVEYDGAKLLTEAGEEVVNSKVQATSNPTGGGTITPAPSSSYTVKVAETTNGTASVSASSAMSGETVTVTAVPAEGYVVKDIKVADALGNAVEVKDGAFVMPAANVVVTVEFAEKTEEPTDKPTEETTFADVPAGHWAAEAIDYLKSVGAVNGKTETEFDPDGSVTRAEFTKMLVSLIDTEAAATGVEFADCPADAWYTPYVAKAVAMGLVNGVSDTEFAPNSTISREDVCTIIGRFLNITAEIEDKELTFTDAADVAEYAARYVAYMAELGIVNGYADGSFGPKASITRAESAKVLYGLSKVL
ncbi:MAG: S-layer homology domain-containing protein, partial [Monoglobaceae bacterium]